MPDPRITDALRALEPDVPSDATEVALRDVRARAAQRRRRGRVGVAVAAAAAIAVVAGTLALLDLGDDGRRTVVVADPPTTESTATTTTTPTTVPSTATTIPTETSAPGVGTFDDLAGGVSALELHNWFSPEDPTWTGLWTADPMVADDVASAIAGSGDGVLPDVEGDLTSFRFRLIDGRVVTGWVDLESGWVGQLESGEPAPGRSLPQELTHLLRTGYNDAVGTPWAEPEGGLENPEVERIVEAAGFPIAELADVPAAIDSARPSAEGGEYERWFVEVFTEGHGPIVEIRRRGLGDDSVSGWDMRFSLVESPDGWGVGGVTTRSICARSTPGPPPDHLCL